jgi:crotonobetainyl-CoA:carnitine CoA-transferase CaiB-like acyl-CoA transferase
MDLDHPESRGPFCRLVEQADVLVEAFPAGYLAALGLDYRSLAALNPRLVLVSLSPFGQDGPHAAHAATDLTLWARGGYLHLTGDPDRPPVRISLAPQINYHAATIGASAALMALRQCRTTGRGQHVDLAMQALPAWMLANTGAFWDLDRVNIGREGAWRDVGGGMRVRVVFRCKDGFITWAAMSGVIGARALHRLVAWMDAEGMAPDWLKAVDWLTVNLRALTHEEFERYSDVFEQFFLTKTKSELMEAAIKDGHMFGAVNTVADVAQSPQLAARDYWQTVEYPNLGCALRYPGPPARMSATPWTIRGRAPSIGEHNAEVYGGLLGMETAEINRLGEAGAI